MWVNNDALIESLTVRLPSARRARQARAPSSFILPRALPPLSHLENLGLKEAAKSRHSHILSDSLSTALETPLDAYPAPTEAKTNTRVNSVAGTTGTQRRTSVGNKSASKQYQPFEILRAIERKDLMTLSEIRTAQFELLIHPIGSSTPLVHAMRLGQSHQEVAVFLIGAISRRVNDITDEDLDTMDPNLKALLRSIRSSLQIAISQGLVLQDTVLLASYLQTIVMSEGDKWIRKASHQEALALRAGPSGKPVEAAEKMLAKWMSRELKKSQIAAVQEYISNATGDLVLMGLWSVVTDAVKGEELPVYYFARDDRISKTVEERIDDLKKQGEWPRLSPLVKKQLSEALRVLQDRTVGGRERILKLKQSLDQQS